MSNRELCIELIDELNETQLEDVIAVLRSIKNLTEPDDSVVSSQPGSNYISNIKGEDISMLDFYGEEAEKGQDISLGDFYDTDGDADKGENMSLKDFYDI